MAVLKELLHNVKPTEFIGTDDKQVKNVCFDSREAREDSLFVAVKGTRVDGHHYIDQSIEKGATSVICEELPKERQEKVSYVQVDNSARALGIIANNYYGNPSTKLALVGVTGTNGKTTVATLLHKLYRKLGYNAGLLSTVENRINDEVVSATHTTPDPVQLASIMAKMVEKKCRYCFMEVSSHAIDQNRISGLHFAGGIFTNITHDHLDYHGTFDAYIKAKKAFFDELPSDAFALVNIDDRRGNIMLQNTRARKKTYALKSMADFKGRILESSFNGLIMDVVGQELYLRLVGEFNAYNMLAVYGTSVLLGSDATETLSVLSTLKAAEGRFDYVTSEREQVTGIVDYAHTPDALKNVLASINDIRSRQEALITVVGCGGDRDKAKRPLMAKIAGKLSDKVILTSDNPRTEDPTQILKDMQDGISPEMRKKVLTIENRKEAIRTAVLMSQPKDIILIAGKGHEKYQEVNGVKHPFDDKKILQETFKELDK